MVAVRAASAKYLKGRERQKRHAATPEFLVPQFWPGKIALGKAHAGGWERDTSAEEEAMILAAKCEARAERQAKRRKSRK